MAKNQAIHSKNILSVKQLDDKPQFIFTRFHFTKSKCFAETIDCTMLRKNIAVLQMSIWKQNKALGTYCVSAYICRTKQWSFFFWYYYIYGIEKTIYYGSKRATTKERELTCLLKMTFYILEFQSFMTSLCLAIFVYLSMKSLL